MGTIIKNDFERLSVNNVAFLCLFIIVLADICEMNSFILQYIVVIFCNQCCNGTSLIFMRSLRM